MVRRRRPNGAQQRRETHAVEPARFEQITIFQQAEHFSKQRTAKDVLASEQRSRDASPWQELQNFSPNKVAATHPRDPHSGQASGDDVRWDHYPVLALNGSLFCRKKAKGYQISTAIPGIDSRSLSVVITLQSPRFVATAPIIMSTTCTLGGCFLYTFVDRTSPVYVVAQDSAIE